MQQTFFQKWRARRKVDEAIIWLVWLFFYCKYKKDTFFLNVEGPRPLLPCCYVPAVFNKSEACKYFLEVLILVTLSQNASMNPPSRGSSTSPNIWRWALATIPSTWSRKSCRMTNRNAVVWYWYLVCKFKKLIYNEKDPRSGSIFKKRVLFVSTLSIRRWVWPEEFGSKTQCLL